MRARWRGRRWPGGQRPRTIAKSLRLNEVYDGTWTPDDMADHLRDLGIERERINVHGGATALGHPIGATGLRMMFECWLQFRGQAGPRQLLDPTIGLTHNLGGRPGRCVSFVGIVGKEPSDG